MAMTLEEVRDRLREENRILGQMDQRHAMVNRSYLEAWADAIDAHITQPAQAVDVGVMVQVIADMRNTTEIWPVDVDRWALAITRALAGEQAGWLDALKLGREAWECYLVSGGGDPVAHAKFIATVKDFLKRANVLLPASPTPDKETQR